MNEVGLNNSPFNSNNLTAAEQKIIAVAKEEMDKLRRKRQNRSKQENVNEVNNNNNNLIGGLDINSKDPVVQCGIVSYNPSKKKQEIVIPGEDAEGESI